MGRDGTGSQRKQDLGGNGRARQGRAGQGKAKDRQRPGKGGQTGSRPDGYGQVMTAIVSIIIRFGQAKLSVLYF